MVYMKKRLIITGASGFIGTNLLQDFVNGGYEVMNIDSQPPRNPDHHKYWRNVNVLDRVKLEQTVLPFEPCYLIHLAARTDLNGKTLSDYEANMSGVNNILAIINKANTLEKVLIASSMLVCKVGYQPKDQFDYCPTTFYGESKVITEKIVRENCPKCDWALLRPTSIWGPWFGVPYRNFFDMVMSRRYFHIGHRGCTKTYGYVGNAVYQIKQILFSNGTGQENKVFYLGDEPPTNIETWGNEIATELDLKIPTLPYGIIRMAAWFGDGLKLAGLSFPMTSFRLRNMTTDNVVDLRKTIEVAPHPPFTRIDGVRQTLEWMKQKQ